MQRSSMTFGLCISALVALGSAAALGAPSQALITLRQHLLDADINTLTFRSIDRMFETLKVPNGGPVWKLTSKPAALDFSYQFDGKTIPAADFPVRTYTNAILVIRNNKIVFEKYLNNTNEHTHFLSMSMAKSITSTLIGMAIEDGAISSVNDQIVKYVPELKGTGYDGVTIRQALMMRSGVDWNERYDFAKQSPMAQLHEAAIVENKSASSRRPSMPNESTSRARSSIIRRSRPRFSAWSSNMPSNARSRTIWRIAGGNGPGCSPTDFGSPMALPALARP